MTIFQRVILSLTALTTLFLQVACTHAPIREAINSLGTPATPPAITTTVVQEVPPAPAPAAAIPAGLHKPAWEKHFVVEVTLRGEINDSAATDITAVVEQLNASRHDQGQDPVEAVVFILDTPGGSLTSGTIIAEQLQSLEMPLVCVVDSHAYSMGAWLVENVCPVRLATTRASMMFHEPHFSGDVTLSNPKRGDFESISESLRVETEAWMARCAERMGMTLPDLMLKIHNREWWMTAREALEAKALDGVIDSIGADVTRPLERNLELPAGVVKTATTPTSFHTP